MNKSSSLPTLLFLGLIWSSFALFTKFAAEVFSPFFIAFGRVFIGGTLLYFVALLQKRKIFIKKNLRQYLITGFFSFTFPFILFAIAVRHLDSGVVTILNGTTPMFEVLISFFFLKHHINKASVFGIVLGIIGVIITSLGKLGTVDITPSYIMAVIMILCATTSYAIASLYVKSVCKNVDAVTMVSGSMLCAALTLSPSILFIDPASLLNLKAVSSLAALGLFCTGIGYFFFFKLIQTEGVRFAVSVVLLVPFFGVIVGAVFLGEPITASKIIGGITILISMKFTLNLPVRNFFKPKAIPVV
jgi:drug/metabolite transporter (DMT)-like permease